MVTQRLQQAMALSELSPDEFVGTLLPTMLPGTPPERVDAFGASMRAFHPTGFRAMARASAESVRDVLPHVHVPTLLVHGDQDVRAPSRSPRTSMPRSPGRGWSSSGRGHACNIEAPAAFDQAVRAFLLSA